MPKADAEFYCFDDYRPLERSFIDDTYVRLAELPLYVDESTATKSRCVLLRQEPTHFHNNYVKSLSLC